MLFKEYITSYITKLRPLDPSIDDQIHWHGQGKKHFTVKGAYEVLI